MSTTTMTASQSSSVDAPRLGALAKLGYLLMLAGVVILGVSGVGTFLTGKAPMTHWVLMLHVGASPAFSVGLALVALTWPARLSRQVGLARGLFWLLLLAGLVVILSGVVPMTPLFGTHGQHLLYLTHRYGGMAVAGLAVLHLLTLGIKRR